MFGTIIGAIVSAVVSFAKTVGTLGLSLSGLGLLSNAIVSFAKALGLVPGNDTAETLGDKAFQAEEAGINPDGFTSYADYLRAVEEFKINPEKTDQKSVEDRLTKGMELAAGILLEEKPELSVESWLESTLKNPDYYTPERMTSLVEICQDSVERLSNALGYLSGTEKKHEKIQDAMETLIAVEKSANPEIDERTATLNVMQARQA